MVWETRVTLVILFASVLNLIFGFGGISYNESFAQEQEFDGSVFVIYDSGTSTEPEQEPQPEPEQETESEPEQETESEPEQETEPEQEFDENTSVSLDLCHLLDPVNLLDLCHLLDPVNL